MNVCLLVSSLEFGGAERQVVEMVKSFDRNHVNPCICSLSKEIPLAANLPNAANELEVVQKRSKYDVTTVLRVASFLRRRKIDVVHAFLFDAEIVARLAAPLAGVRAVIASERNTDYKRPLKHRIAFKLTQPLFDVMVANSTAGKRFNIRTLGLAEKRIEVVHNGVDVERFKPDRDAGLRFRASIGVPDNAPVVGMVGSYKLQKAHDVFLQMAARVKSAIKDVRFVIVGEPLRDNFEQTSRRESEIKAMAVSLGLEKNCIFMGNQKDVRAVYNACDITALLSRHEGTPNVVLESMACGVPVVVTDIADNAIIVANGTTGYVVAKEDFQTASVHAVSLLGNASLRQQFSAAARAHVLKEFSLQRAAGKLQAIYAMCLSRKN